MFSELSAGVSRHDLFNVWRNANENSRFDAVLSYVLDKSDLKHYDDNVNACVRKTLQNFCAQLLRKWKMCNRTTARFLCVHKNWLEGKVFIEGLHPVSNVQEGTAVLTPPTEKDAVTSKGRPTKRFAACNESTKRKKIQHLLKCSREELTMATQMKLREEGERDAARLVKMVSGPNNSAIKATTIKKLIACPTKLPTKLSVEKALALYIDNKFTKEQYISIQQISKEHNANIYPTYENLLTAKKECYPNNILITDISAEINLQSLLNHTIHRLVTAQIEVLESRIEDYDPTSISIIFKWGCDGASGHSCYKQAFEKSDCDDSFLFIISLVPLRMSATSTENNNQIVLWQNPIPSSTKYCRPIKIMFHKETADFTRAEVGKIKAQIEDLVPANVEIRGQRCSIHPRLLLTMIDGKICSTLTHISGQNCHICGATPKLMNNLEEVRRRPIDEESLELGMSSLHAWIKCFECLLHIAYRLDIKTWQIKKTDKPKTDARKQNIQERFRREMSLLVDIPKQGYGNTNDGNTARRFFANPELSSNITGVNQTVIKHFDTVLRTITCGYAINVEAFENYCAHLAQLFVNEYSWYYMPQSVHKILIHGGQIIRVAALPIGQLSEEAQEARNKDSRRFREFHTRKFSRKKTIEDLIHMLLISSDPLISSIRKRRVKLSGELPNDVIALLDYPSPNTEKE